MAEIKRKNSNQTLAYYIDILAIARGLSPGHSLPCLKGNITVNFFFSFDLAQHRKLLNLEVRNRDNYIEKLTIILESWGRFY